MDHASTPTHDLIEVQEKVRVGFVHYSRSAIDGAAELEFDRSDIDACISALTSADFHKTMPAYNPRWPGAMQDVYKPDYEGKTVYVKFQLWPGNRLHVVSFKRKDPNDLAD